MYNENLWLSFLFILVCVKLEAKRENLSFLGWHFFGVPVRVFVRCSWHYKKQKLFLTLSSCHWKLLAWKVVWELDFIDILWQHKINVQIFIILLHSISDLVVQCLENLFTRHERGMAWAAAKVFRCLRYCAVLSGRMSRRVVALAHTKFLCCWKISSSSTPDSAVDFYRAMRWCSRKENRSDVSKDGEGKFDENSSSRQHSNPLTPTFTAEWAEKALQTSQ